MGDGPVFGRVTRVTFVRGVSIVLVTRFPRPGRSVSGRLLRGLGFGRGCCVSISGVCSMGVGVFYGRYCDSSVVRGNGVTEKTMVCVGVPSCRPVLLVTFRVRDGIG